MCRKARKLYSRYLFILLLLLPKKNHGDTVILKDGSHTEGQVISRSDESVTITLKDGSRKKIPSSQIDRIEFSFQLTPVEENPKPEPIKSENTAWIKSSSIVAGLHAESLPLSIPGSSGFGMGGWMYYLARFNLCDEIWYCPRLGGGVSVTRFLYLLSPIDVSGSFLMPAARLAAHWEQVWGEFSYSLTALMGVYVINTTIARQSVSATKPLLGLAFAIGYSPILWLPHLVVQPSLYFESEIYVSLMLGVQYEKRF